MSVVPANLIASGFAPATDTVVYTAPSNTTVIVDKFTATNIDTGAQTISVNIYPAGGSVGNQNRITSLLSIAAGASVDLPEQHNQILNPGDQLSAKASVANKIVIRMNGRLVT